MSQFRLYHGAQLAQAGHAPQDIALLLNAQTGIWEAVESSVEVLEPLLKQIPATKLERVDAQGCLVLPGLFDTNVHLREPGREDAETIKSGTQAALHGGFTGMLAMPNTNPAIDTGGMVRSMCQLVREEAYGEVLIAGSITQGRKGKQLAELGDMAARGAVLVTDDHQAVANPQLMRRAMEYARNFDLIVGSHCDEPELSRGGSMNEGEVSYLLGLPGIPACAEEIAIARDLRLAELTGVHLHIQHVSTAEGVATIRRYKERGVRVSAEVTPHHLLLDQTDLTKRPYDSHLKMMPPLRTPEDRQALLEGLLDGTLDVIATDHAPHSRGEKQKSFQAAPFGVIGLETALPCLHEALVLTGKLSWGELMQKLSAQPRALFRLPEIAFEQGELANFTLFDSQAISEINAQFLHSKSRNTPYWQQRLQGAVRETNFAQTRFVFMD